jgi:hypothetical protein
MPLEHISPKWKRNMHSRMFAGAWPYVQYSARRLRAARETLTPAEDLSLALYWEQGKSGAACSRRSGVQPAKVLRKLKEKIVKSYTPPQWKRIIAASR